MYSGRSERGSSGGQHNHINNSRMRDAALEQQIDELSMDVLEQDRVGFEQLIGAGVPEPPLSSCDEQDNNSFRSEVGRHGGPSHSPVPIDPYSIYGREGDFDYQEFRSPRSPFNPPRHKQLDASFRTEDQSFANAGGETISTAAHHRSALSVGAGLRRPARPTAPASENGEYDPDRQLDDLLDGRGHLSMFDATSRSKRSRTPRKDDRSRVSNKSGLQSFASLPTFDPVIVEDTAELDRAVEAGHFQLNTTIPPPRPTSFPVRLEDANSQSGSGDSSFHRSEPGTPRTRPRLAAALERAASPQRPYSPPTRPGQTPKNAAYADAWREANARSSRPPFADLANRTSEAAPLRRATTLPIARTDPPEVQLPDVTGITEAVGTPLRSRLSYVPPSDRPFRPLAHGAVEQIATKLREAEREHTTSRRRIHELEAELEYVNQQVQEDKSHVDEHRSRSSVDGGSPGRWDPKGKRREQDTPHVEGSAAYWEERYRHAIADKEELEKFVDGMRAHIAVLTRKLEERNRQLDELRALRDRDARQLEIKVRELKEANRNVDELTAEVRQLREAVEDGIQVRRTTREADEMIARGLGDLSTVREATNEDEDEDLQRTPRAAEHEQQQYLRGRHGTSSPPTQDPDSGYDTETDREAQQYNRQPRAPNPVDDTIEYTQADQTVDSIISNDQQPRNPSPQPVRHARFRPPSSLSNRVAEDDPTTSSLGRPLPVNQRRFVPRPYVESEVDVDDRRLERSMPEDHDVSDVNSDPGSISQAQAQRARAAVNRRKRASDLQLQELPETINPTPQLRGQEALRLFNETSDHDVSTCRKCRNRNLAKSRAKDEQWLADFMKRRSTPAARRAAKPEQLPPRMALARLARELGDEFTHQKSIYTELAEEYAKMDATSNVAKRNILADHLREVIDVLETRGDQIAALEDLLATTFLHS